MCEHGDTVVLRLKTLAAQSHTGADRWRDWRVDRCIAPIVEALQAAGIDMRGSCCGHNQRPGEIELADGRVLAVFRDAEEFLRIQSALDPRPARQFACPRR